MWQEKHAKTVVSNSPRLVYFVIGLMNSLLGPVQMSCFCRAELNSGIKFDKSTAEAWRLNQTFELSSASN